MSFGGDFNQDAYKQLHEAYAKQLQGAKEVEKAGHDLLNINLPLETIPIDSPWADKVENWSYPNGKSEYLDGRQSPEEILEIMREAAKEKAKDGEQQPGTFQMLDAKQEGGEEPGLTLEEDEELSDEQIDEMIKSLLDDEEDGEDEVDETAEADEPEEQTAEQLAAQIEELKAALSQLGEEADEEVIKEEVAEDEAQETEEPVEEPAEQPEEQAEEEPRDE